jgi:CheY-like chemotaxis protein
LAFQEAIIFTDSPKLNGILTNLIKNAIKFTDIGSVEFGYELMHRDNSKMLQFFVKDTGQGIPLNRQDAIFGRFIQADISNKSAYQGAGLGLSISKAYVEMLGGKIWFESEPEKGSVFNFTIPYDLVPFIENPIKKEIKEKTKITPASNLKILIVEDDEGLEFLLTEAVKDYCNEPLIARDGLEAVDISSKNPDLDLILMDIRLPKMDGYEATSEIRKFNQKVPIIAQTACVFFTEQEKATEAGCNDFVTKPIDYAVLRMLIEKHIS